MLRRLLGVSVRLEVRCAQAPWRVKADPSQLEQVVLNLAVNARDAMPAGGDLLLETSQLELTEEGARESGLLPGRYVALVATDTGVGMPPEILARVFEPFFTTKERGKGTGLGLATVYGIVTQAGGAVRLTSELGKGTTFRVLLPATTEEPKVEDLRQERTPAAANATVLVAEDDPAVREITRRILESAGYRVKLAPDAESALKLAEEAPPDLLLTDLVMPGLGGKQLARVLRERQPGLPVLYMSAYFEDAAAANESGIELLGKPFSREDLLGLVRRLLEAGGQTPLV
jgi:CheY-like chemotaxis protein